MARNSFTCASSGSSPISSRNSVPPSASTNLPTCRSVAPVKAPFSCPNLLAGPGLALDQHRDGRGGGALAEPDRLRHRRAAAAEIGEGQRRRLPAGDAAHLALERAGGQRVADGDVQPLGRDRLDDEVGGAGPHRRDHGVDRAVRCLHDHRRPLLALGERGEDGEAVDIRHLQVEHQEIDAARLDRAQGCGAAVDDERLVAESAHHRLEQTALHRVVVGDEDFCAHRAPVRTDVSTRIVRERR
jgi:hypothetical protein